MLSKGADVESVLRVLRDNGFSKVHSIKALVDLGRASLADAKSIVHSSGAWEDRRESDEAFQQSVEEAFRSKN
jgi:hypothetical protein